MKRHLTILAFLATLTIAGCASLDAWRGNLAYNQKTGQLEGDLKGAAPGGAYNENTGLNLTSGDNTIPALVIAGLLVIGIVFVYPVQRSLRIRREEKFTEWKAKQNMNGS